MKKILATIISISTFSCLFSQVGIGTTSVNSSAVLEISSSTQKGLLPPRVTMGTDLSSTTTPVTTPAEGSILYNSSNTNQIVGYYERVDGNWVLLASKENSLKDMVYKSSATYTFTPTSGGYTPLADTKIFGSELTNTLKGTYNSSNGSFTISPGKYLVKVTLNIATTESTTTGVNSTVLHLHKYQARLVNTSNSAQLGNISYNSALSTADNKNHTVTFQFNFQTTTSIPIQFNLGYDSTGGTYTGAVTLNDAYIHIQKSVIK